VTARKVLIKNPNAGQGQAVEEPARYVLAMAKEGRGHHVTGDQKMEGATLRIVVNGAVPSDETYLLAASGWQRVGPDGFRFRSTGPVPQPNPVSRVSIRRTGGSFELKAILAGNRGTDDLDVLPASASPAPPLVQGDLDDLGLSLQLGASGATYCFRIGGAAGGVVRRDHARESRVVSTAASPANTTLGCP